MSRQVSDTMLRFINSIIARLLQKISYLQVLKFNGTRIKNIHHLAHLVDCK